MISVFCGPLSASDIFFVISIIFAVFPVAMTTKVAIIPGNGGGDVEQSNWYPWVRDQLDRLPGVQAQLQNMPDPVYAREKKWIPFMRNNLHCDEDTIILGHSSGCEAAMRFAETYKVKGIVLVSAYHTDMGKEYERISGYFDRPWEWAKIRENTGFIVQFGSTDDHAVPFAEQQEVATQLGSELKKYSDRGHFLQFEFPEVVDVIKKKLSSSVKLDL
eukprot:GHVO01045951.1.p1 GENE.GHVO01045951.1~~GHVO01045951.1.p1  ORF type:complete len:217 (+),score=22.58 GHVO01045951.1:28-678(+)